MELITENQYFMCINLYSALFKSTSIKIEQFEQFQKMSFRNRCIISGSNGLISLTVPVVGGRNTHQLVKDVKINYQQNWQLQHWRTITSCYARSPFFEFYQDELALFFTKRYDFLWDLNWDILQWVCKQLKYKASISATETFEKNYNAEVIDLRNRWLPNNYQLPPFVTYNQVFENKTGFHPNLSILDLLFCEGGNAKNIIS